MESLYAWIRSLAGYFVFLAVLEQLMSGKKSGRYVHFFAGIILILLVLKPLTGGFHLDEALVREYEALLFQYQAEDLRRELTGAEHQRLNQMVDQYELAVAKTVEDLARAEGCQVRECRVTIGRDSAGEQFGEVTGIRLDLAGAGPGGEALRQRLGRKLAAYYNLEEQYVEIQIVEREG